MKRTEEITGCDNFGVQPGDVIVVSGAVNSGRYVVCEVVNSTTLKIKPQRWYHRLWALMVRFYRKAVKFIKGDHEM